jgi:hypothetical protein
MSTRKIGADLVGDLAEAAEVDLARIGRAAGDDQLAAVLAGEAGDLVQVDQVVLRRTPYWTALNHLPDWLAGAPWVRWPPAARLMPRNGVAGLQQREEHGLVRLAAGVRLDVGEAAAEQLLGALDGEFSAMSTNWQPP